MSEGTKIQWADDTANFWRGCTKVSLGCAHCYAEKNIGVKMNGIQWGNGAARARSATIEASRIEERKLLLYFETISKTDIVRESILLLVSQISEKTQIVPLVGTP